MRTQFPYSERIDLNAYLDAYFQQENAIRRLPTEEELKELARKAIVKGRLELTALPADGTTQAGDTVTLRTASELPKFNRERVVVTVGRGLYDRALEEALVGKKVGETCEVAVKDRPVSATVLEIKRKSVPEPTDEMVQALDEKDLRNQPVTTVADYEAFIREQKIKEDLETINRYILQACQKDYPLTEYDEEDLQDMGRMARAFWRQWALERSGVDLETASEEEFQKVMGCDSMETLIARQRDWYKQAIHITLIYLGLLGLPCEGETDPRDHYMVPFELMDKLSDVIKDELIRRNAQ